MSDYLETLPVDEFPMAPEDSQLLNTILQESKSDSIQQLLHDSKVIFVAAILFFIINTQAVQYILKTIIPYTNHSTLSLLLVQVLIFTILLYFAENFQYSRLGI